MTPKNLWLIQYLDGWWSTDMCDVFLTRAQARAWKRLHEEKYGKRERLRIIKYRLDNGGRI
jgi:hypothetical protein